MKYSIRHAFRLNYVFDYNDTAGYVVRIPELLANGLVRIANRLGKHWDYDLTHTNDMR